MYKEEKKLSEHFDYLKKVIDGIDKDFITGSAESLRVEKLNVNKNRSYESEDFIEIKETQKKKSGNMFIGLSAVAAAIVCAVSVAVFAVVKGNEVSIVNSSAQEVSSTTDKELLNSSDSPIITDAEFLSLEEIYSTADDALLKKYDRLSMPESITLDEVGALYIFTADWNVKGNAEKIKKDIVQFGDIIIGESIVLSDVQYDESKSIYFWKNGSGFIECATDLNEGYNIAFTDDEYTSLKENYSYEKMIRFDRGEPAEGEYTLNGTIYSVSDATEYCNQTLEKLEQFIHPSEDLRLKTLFIKKLDEGRYTYKFIAEKLINGIPLDEGCNYSNVKTGMSKPTFVVVEIDAPEHINNAVMFYSNSYVTDDQSGDIKMHRCDDSFITLSSACDILSDSIYSHFDINDIDIKYASIISNYGGGVPSAAKYRPMWTFVLDEKLTHDAFSNDDTRICAYVDMQSGEVYIVDNIEQNIYFELSSTRPLINTELEKAPIDILDKETTEVKQLVNSYPNLKASDNMFINVPEKSTVYSYIGRYPTPEQMPQDFEKFFEEYKAYFKAFFPDREMKDEYMFFTSPSGNVELSDRMLISDNYDDLVAGKYSAVYQIYHEDINQPNTATNRVAFMSPWAIGYGGLWMNKGKTLELAGPTVWYADDYGNPKRAYPSLIDYQPDAYFRYVGTYSPESEMSFNLLDGEATIKSCVDYYEDFVNNKLPTPENANVTTVVTSVDVLQINDEVYCYYFQVAPMLDNVIIETKLLNYSDSTLHYSYNLHNTNALMVESDDVDCMNGYFRIEGVEEGTVRMITDIISFETALNTVSDKMGDYVSFEVEKVEFLYRQKSILTEEGYIDVHNGSPYESIPAWKFTLFNPNDNKYFATYVYAESGEFDYFTYTD